VGSSGNNKVLLQAKPWLPAGEQKSTSKKVAIFLGTFLKSAAQKRQKSSNLKSAAIFLGTFLKSASYQAVIHHDN